MDGEISATGAAVVALATGGIVAIAVRRWLLARRARAHRYRMYLAPNDFTNSWAMVRRTAPDLVYTFERIGRILSLSSSYAPFFTAHAYERMRAVNFSSGVCEPLVSWLRVLPLPEVGWSDWGTEGRILASLQNVGTLDACLARLRHDNVDTTLGSA